jgi:tRNA threonylcarbamoyladenosine biosynthesis protein TsaE
MFFLSSRDQTRRLAERLAPLLRPGDTLTLSGDLGTGKTTFCAFLLAALGWNEEVPSPTYTVAHLYPLPAFTVWHFDCYRLNDAMEIYMAGWQETGNGVRLIEWPEKIATLLPKNRLALAFSHGIEEDQRNGEARQCHLTLHGDWPTRQNAIKSDAFF